MITDIMKTKPCSAAGWLCGRSILVLETAVIFPSLAVCVCRAKFSVCLYERRERESQIVALLWYFILVFVYRLSYPIITDQFK